MKAVVFRDGHQFEILNPIVETVAVLVVNELTPSQLAPYRLLHDEPVLVDA
jgi:hypothetical protein